ncbi:MAG: septum formation initiator family protein [Candidatus Yanofskybacteria bacterium]|nr:septum formation initiator family protein [Candidatus Yanofskybacteria bacterium]
MIKIFQSKIVTVVLVIVVGWLILSALGIKAKRENVSGEMRDIKAQIDRLNKENDFLSRLQDYFRSESFLEQQARLKLNFKDADENVVFIYPNAEEIKNETPRREESDMENYKKWWYYLMSR